MSDIWKQPPVWWITLIALALILLALPSCATNTPGPSADTYCRDTFYLTHARTDDPETKRQHGIHNGRREARNCPDAFAPGATPLPKE